MKKHHLIYIAFLFLFLLAACSESDSPTEPGENTGGGAALYYPGGVGSSFIYSKDTLDRSSANYVNIGQRTSSFQSSRNESGTSIFTQINRTVGTGSMDTSSVEFWRSNNGVYFLVDTSGFSEFLGEIPDSISNLLTFTIDSQMNAFSAPLTSGKVWSAFKLNIGIPAFGISRSLIEVSGAYKGQETVTVPPNNDSRTAERIDYTIKLSIPDESNILDTTSQYYSGKAWFVENVGLVKLEGNALLINTIGSGVIDLADSSSVIRETLTSYELK